MKIKLKESFYFIECDKKNKQFFYFITANIQQCRRRDGFYFISSLIRTIYYIHNFIIRLKIAEGLQNYE